MTAATDQDVRDLVDRFNDTWNRHDLEAALALVSDDCVFDATGPAPDGTRVAGKDAIREAWAGIFADPNSRFSVEESVVAGDRLVQLWRYEWDGGHVRGVDVISTANGLITAKLAYVKG
jgi:uncharacterized protein (TIGR02246 family)